MKKKSFNEISGTMSKAEMKNVMGGPNYCTTKCTGTQNPCIYDPNSIYGTRCFCPSFSTGDPRFFFVLDFMPQQLHL